MSLGLNAPQLSSTQIKGVRRTLSQARIQQTRTMECPRFFRCSSLPPRGNYGGDGSKTGNPVVKSDTRVHHEAFWSQHAATRATCSDADRNTIDEHQWISSSGTDGSRRNTPTLDPTVHTDRNRTLHEHHVSTNTSIRPGRQRTTHVHAGGSHGHGPAMGH